MVVCPGVFGAQAGFPARDGSVDCSAGSVAFDASVLCSSVRARAGFVEPAGLALAVGRVFGWVLALHATTLMARRGLFHG